MPTDKRRTHRTDANGNLLDRHKGLFELEALENARKAGVPEIYLDRAGWVDGDESARGLFAECVYFLGDMLSELESDMSRVAIPIDWMERICREYEVNPRSAIPYDAARFLRQYRDSKDGRPAKPEDVESLSDAWDSMVVGEWGMPSGPEHDQHSHGLANGVWTCLKGA